ncbi:hypothetical protein cypCar_00010823, partial [Cyprinus carpio]
TRLMKTQKDVQQMILDRTKKIQDIKYLAELRKKSTEQEKAANAELFSDLMRSIERCQAELLGMMEEKQKISELKMRDTELDHLLHTEDHLQLLQVSVSLSAHITEQHSHSSS